jgi:hypothetical protein
VDAAAKQIEPQLIARRPANRARDEHRQPVESPGRDDAQTLLQ